MKHKDKQEAKEEKTGRGVGELEDFYGMLDSLLPQKHELLRAVLENLKKHSKEVTTNQKQQSDDVLGLEKEKTNCLLEMLKISLDQYLRTSADYANYQKRMPKQMADSIAYEKERMVRALLPVLDNFERTLRNAHMAVNTDSIIKGVKIIYDQMLDILKLQGVEWIKAEGEKFDPAVHEAVIQKSESDKEEGIVLEELERGYKLNGRVIRPGKVVVNKVTSIELAEKQAGEKPPEQATEEETTDME